jgi:DNA-binding GntR family transcriptional regulator
MNKPESPGTVRPGNTVDSVFSRLKGAIYEGQFAPGQRLIEADLTREYNVSRGPVREALQRLAAEGVVNFVPNRGAVVRRFSRKEVADLFLIREALEGLAVRQATKNLMSMENRQPFMDAIKALEDPPQQYRRNFATENQMFHSLIVELSDNPQLDTLLIQLRLPLVRFQIRGALDQNYLEQSRREHSAIADAILKGDHKRAEKCMRQHLERASERLLNLPGLFPEDADNPG